MHGARLPSGLWSQRVPLGRAPKAALKPLAHNLDPPVFAAIRNCCSLEAWALHAASPLSAEVGVDGSFPSCLNATMYFNILVIVHIAGGAHCRSIGAGLLLL